MAFTPLLSHVTARPRQAGTSLKSQATIGRQADREPARRDLSTLRPDSLPSRPGRTVYQKTQSGGSARVVLAPPVTQRDTGTGADLPGSRVLLRPGGLDRGGRLRRDNPGPGRLPDTGPLDDPESAPIPGPGLPWHAAGTPVTREPYPSAGRSKTILSAAQMSASLAQGSDL